MSFSKILLLTCSAWAASDSTGCVVVTFSSSPSDGRDSSLTTGSGCDGSAEPVSLLSNCSSGWGVRLSTGTTFSVVGDSGKLSFDTGAETSLSSMSSAVVGRVRKSPILVVLTAPLVVWAYC